MSETYPRPAWGWLLPIPVLGTGFVLYVQGLHPSAVMIDVLGIAALLILGGYIEVWGHINRYALLHITAEDGSAVPLYNEREAVAAKPVRGRVIRVPVQGAPARRLVAPREYVAPPIPALASASGGE